MSTKHPIIAVTASSGAGTTSGKHAFEHIFWRTKIRPAIIEGDSFHSLNPNAFNDTVAAWERRRSRGRAHNASRRRQSAVALSFSTKVRQGRTPEHIPGR